MNSKLEWEDNILTQLKEAPINYPGCIQPHGVLIVLQEPDLVILQVSNNALTNLGMAAEQLLNQKLDVLLDTEQVEKIQAGLSDDDFDFINPTKVWVKQIPENFVLFDAIFHRNTQGVLILELEPVITQEGISFLSFYNLTKAAINRLKAMTSLQSLYQVITDELRIITGFDRVMLYKFSQDGHGVVVAEAKLVDLESFLDLHYPESDIPRPARELFMANSIRLIPNAPAQPVLISPVNHPINQQPLDLTNSILRSADSCHIEYLRNMGVSASLTISLVNQQKLWGLIACHHRSPKYFSYEMRQVCQFFGKVIFTEISSREEIEDYDYVVRLAQLKTQLIEYMSESDNFIDALVNHQSIFLDLTNSTGACVYFSGNCTIIGQTPDEAEIYDLVAWLNQQPDEDIFSTNCLQNSYPGGEKIHRMASGLLAISISKGNYVLWFRPAVTEIVNWGGNPHEPFEISQLQGSTLLSPSKSFARWQEIVSSTSLPWQKAEIRSVLELRRTIVNVILSQSQKLTKLTQELERSNAELKKFAYVTSHDLQAPLNQVVNYVQLLERRYKTQLDEDARELINYAVEGVSLMQSLIDDVLSYSKVDTQPIALAPIPMERSLEVALSNLRQEITETAATITHDTLPTVIADHTQMVQIFLNLISNSIKFHSHEPLKIHVGAEKLANAWLFSLRDNGIGIDPQFHQRIFIIFQQLHVRDEYPGTGVGLAICKKIIERHQGRIWVDSQLNEGATFYFTIPLQENKIK